MLGRVDCIRSASTEALEWAKAINQDEAPNVPLEDHDDDLHHETKRVHFTIYSVSFSYIFDDQPNSNLILNV